MGYRARIETKDATSFITTRLRNSELWFINNNDLKEAILGYLARYSERYGVKLYAFGLQGNHTHIAADFPGLNRGGFMRDFNSTTAKAIINHVDTYPGGRSIGRRHSAELMPGDADVMDRFFYIVLQAVKDGLVENIEKFPGYNCFEDAIYGREAKYPMVDWSRYNAARKRPRKTEVDIAKYTTTYTLRYERLPGFENTPQEEYVARMREELEVRRLKFIADRKAKGKTACLGVEKLLAQVPGSRPVTTKKSTRKTPRPITLSVCATRRRECDALQFDLRAQYKEASRRYRAGDTSVVFPPGMYKPHCPVPGCVPATTV